MIVRVLHWLQSRTVSRVLFAVTACSVAAYLARCLSGFSWRDLRIDLVWMACAAVVQGFFMAYGAWLWHRISRMTNVALPLPETMAVWAYSNFGKYLPMKLTGLGYRMAVYTARGGYPAVRVTQACYVELLTSVLGGGVALALLAGLRTTVPGVEWKSQYGIVAVAAMAVLLLLLLPATHRRLFNWGLGLLGRRPAACQVRLRDSLAVVGLSALGWGGAGVVFYCLLRSMGADLSALGGLPGASLLYVAAVNAGNISVFVPSGLGVREAVLLLGLGGAMPPALAAVTVIVARVLTIGVDAAGIAAGFWWIERNRIAGRAQGPRPE